VKNYRHFLVVVLGVVCLQFTGVRADPAQDSTPRPDFYVEDPLAPHHTTGTTARLGTSVGFLYGERLDALALGAVVAGGKRWGRFALEAEYGYYELSEKGPSDRVLGDAQRLGVISRLEVVRLGSSIVGGNSMLSLYVEGGVGVAWNDWYTTPTSSGDRIVPIDTKRVEGQAGFGIMLDHRLQEPIGFPHRIGWFLGWRLAFAPHETEPASICRGVSCRAAPMMAEDRFIDRSMMFGSSLSVTW
jgi:hypothetical protein